MIKLGSLFDGSGGFPLAGSLCGFEPVWASEVEPYPISVTKSRFPKMRHLGDISKINGAEIEPVDIITFGSPCQDLSVAGKRAGLKHEANGDEETTRSGLFMEAVRIIKEMREATNGEYPSFALWENVPGAFSSNKGEDFRIVLEELIKIVEPSAVMPPVPKNGWAYADSYCGDEWSLAYRVFDAQYWGKSVRDRNSGTLLVRGTPQRRRRIHLVLDLRGKRAGKILFEREGLRGYFTESRQEREEATRNAESGFGTADSKGNSIDSLILDDQGGQQISVRTDGKSPTLRAEMHGNVPCVMDAIPYTLKIRSGCEGGGKGALVQTDMSATLATNNDQYLFQPVKQYLFENLSPTLTCTHGGEPVVYDGSNITSPINAANPQSGDPCHTLSTDSRNWVVIPVKGGEPIALDRAFYNQGQNAQYEPQYYTDGTVPTLVAKGLGAVCVKYRVRRLTPTECARLQGFPDNWGHPDKKDELTEEEYAFWLEVRNTHASINGKQTKEYTKEQMLKWYNSLHTDSAEYKMWGNGIALPPALYCMQGIKEAMK